MLCLIACIGFDLLKRGSRKLKDLLLVFLKKSFGNLKVLTYFVSHTQHDRQRESSVSSFLHFAPNSGGICVLRGVALPRPQIKESVEFRHSTSNAFGIQRKMGNEVS